MAMAAYHLDDEAQLWYQLFKKENLIITWTEFKDEVLSRYGSSEFEDHFEELSKFRQTGSVLEYYKAFIRLVTKAGNVTIDQQVSFFTGGLKDNLRIDVKA